MTAAPPLSLTFRDRMTSWAALFFRGGGRAAGEFPGSRPRPKTAGRGQAGLRGSRGSQTQLGRRGRLACNTVATVDVAKAQVT